MRHRERRGRGQQGLRWLVATMGVGAGLAIVLAGGPASAQSAGPVATINPPETDLGEIRLGTSRTAVLNVANAGPGNLTVTGITLAGDAADEASAANPCTAAIPPGSSCNFNVTISPDQRGSRVVSVNITSNASPAPSSVTVEGVGVASEATPDVTSLAFDETPVDTASVTKRVTFTNTGNATLNTSGVTVGGVSPTDYKIVGETCTAGPVQPNGTCTVDVSFKPVRSGSRLASLQVASDAEPSPARNASVNSFSSAALFSSAATTTSISLSGTGQDATATIAPASLDYGAQVVGLASTKTVTVTNNGPGPLAVRGAAVAGKDAADWTVSNNRCTTILAAAASCTIEVTFIPNATGSRSASLVVTDSSQAGGGSVALTGTANNAPVTAQSASGTTGGTSTAGAAGAAGTTTAAAAAAGALPATGSEVRPMVEAALSLLLIGFGLVLLPLSRRFAAR